MSSFKVFLAGLLVNGLIGTAQGFAAAPSHTTRTDSGGGVTVKVTLLDSKTDGDLRFQVALDTHSVNLDSYDLKSATVLRDDVGKAYLPKAIENKGSGHHRQSTLVFGKITNGTKRLELVIKDVAGVKERIFRWDLK